VRSFRQLRGLSQEELAETVGVDRKTISRIEAGLHSTRVSTLLSISAALEVEPGELLK
jgi:transcriptional regulator with XRE-family HTH domain